MQREALRSGCSASLRRINCARVEIHPYRENRHGSLLDHAARVFEKIGVAGATVGAFGSLETARGFAANDTLSIACIGTGGRCQQLMHSLVKVPGVKITAVCDVYDLQLDRAKKLADSKAITSKNIVRSSIARTSTPS